MKEDEASEEEEAVVALTARSELELDIEPVESLSQLKEKVHGLSKAKLEELLLTLMDECDAMDAKNCMLKDVCSDLKKDVRMLKHANEILKRERLKLDEKTPLCEDLDMLKGTLSMREKVLNTNLSKLESESLQLKQRIESLVCENNQLIEKLHEAKSDLTKNRRWNSSSEALNWLNTHHT